MKTTQYFDYTRKRPDRAQIKEDWITFVIENPEKTEIQSDGRIKVFIQGVNRVIAGLCMSGSKPLKSL